MKEHNINELVFSSSATVYGLPQYLPIDEKHSTGQGITNPYGQTKNMCEQIMKDVCVADPVSIQSIRPLSYLLFLPFLENSAIVSLLSKKNSKQKPYFIFE